MKKRFCQGCADQVEVVDGFCLLGHRAGQVLELGRVTPDPISEIRAEVEKVFEEADLRVQRLVEVPAAVGAPSRAHVPVAAAGSGPHDQRPAPMPLGRTPEAQPARKTPPPPPPPPATRGDMYRDALKHLSDERPTSDPITAFAPPPRVDWGPNKMSLFSLRGLLKPRG